MYSECPKSHTVIGHAADAVEKTGWITEYNLQLKDFKLETFLKLLIAL
jgi:hypothetical protein